MDWLISRFRPSPEKDKRKEMPNRERWMHTRWYALLICGLFFAAGVINIFEVPVLIDFYPVLNIAGDFSFKSMYLAMVCISMLILGVPVAALFTLLHGFLDTINLPSALYLIPSASERMTEMIGLCVMTFVLAGVVLQLQRFRRTFKWLVYLSYMLHPIAIILFLLSSKGGISAQYTATQISCDFSISATTRIHTDSENRHYYLRFYDQEINLTHYSISMDSGRTWHEFMLGSVTVTCPGFSVLRNSGTFDDKFFWLWQGQEVVFTHDGGSTWTLWRQPGKPHSGSCHIERVDFTDEQHGSLKCSYIESGNEVMLTENGGLTGREAAN